MCVTSEASLLRTPRTCWAWRARVCGATARRPLKRRLTQHSCAEGASRRRRAVHEHAEKRDSAVVEYVCGRRGRVVATPTGAHIVAASTRASESERDHDTACALPAASVRWSLHRGYSKEIQPLNRGCDRRCPTIVTPRPQRQTFRSANQEHDRTSAPPRVRPADGARKCYTAPHIPPGRACGHRRVLEHIRTHSPTHSSN
jgi:hypothetical protein